VSPSVAAVNCRGYNTRTGKAFSGIEDPALLYELSCTLAQAAAAAGHDTRLARAERTRVQTHYADQAMEYLRQAVAKGWANWRVMENDPDIEPLRALEDFKHILADAKAKAKR